MGRRYGHPRIGSALTLRASVDIDNDGNGSFPVVGVVIHAGHLQPVEAHELEQFRWVHLELWWARRGLAIRPRGDRDEQVSLLVPLRSGLGLKRMGKVEGCEETVHAERVEMYNQLIRPAVPHVRRIPDGRALPTLRASNLEHLVGVRAEEGDGVHGLPALDIGAEEQRRGGDQQPVRLPRDRPKCVKAGFGRRDVGDGPGTRIVRDDARKVAKRVRDDVQDVRLGLIAGESRAPIRCLPKFLRRAGECDQFGFLGAISGYIDDVQRRVRVAVV